MIAEEADETDHRADDYEDWPFHRELLGVARSSRRVVINVERKRLEVDPIGPGAETFRRRDDGFSEVAWTARCRLCVVQVADEVAQCTFVEAHFLTRTAEFVIVAAAARDEFSEFLSMDHVRGTLGRTMKVTAVDSGRSSSSARSGVTPTPAPISTTRLVSSRWRVKVPYGPSTMTRVPGLKRATARL